MKVYTDIDRIRETDTTAHVLVFTVVSGATVTQAADLCSTLSQERSFKVQNFKWLNWAEEAFIETSKDFYIGEGASALQVKIAINDFVLGVRKIAKDWMRAKKLTNEIVYNEEQMKKHNILPIDKTMIKDCIFSATDSVNKRIHSLLTKRYNLTTMKDIVDFFADAETQHKDIRKFGGFGKRSVQLIRDTVMKNYGIKI